MPQFAEYLSRTAILLPQKAQQYMLGADKMLLQSFGLRRSPLHRCARPGRQALHRHSRAAHTVSADHTAAKRLQTQATLAENTRGQALLFIHHTQQKMLRSHKGMAQLPGLYSGLLYGLLRYLAEFFVAFQIGITLPAAHNITSMHSRLWLFSAADKGERCKSYEKIIAKFSLFYIPFINLELIF